MFSAEFSIFLMNFAIEILKLLYCDDLPVQKKNPKKVDSVHLDCQASGEHKRHGNKTC